MDVIGRTGPMREAAKSAHSQGIRDGQGRPLVKGGDQLLPRVRKCIPSGDGLGDREARCGRVGLPPAAHILRHVPEAKLGDVQGHE